jgi:hypothetical protein
MNQTLTKAAAAASLFLLCAAALEAQTPDAATRAGYGQPKTMAATTQRGPNGWVVIGGAIVEAVLSDKAPRPRADRTPRDDRQAVSEWNRTVDYSGPRFGFTYLPAAVVDTLKGRGIEVDEIISQFGWQLEHEIHVSPDGPMVLNEWVFLAGGLERGVFLPSASWLVGARTKTGNEVAFGPNVSLAGVGLAVAAGTTLKSGGLNFPMNVAAASSKGGVRVSFLTGFTLH